MPKYRLLKPREIVRKTDQARYIVNGKLAWRKVTGHGFKVEDCMGAFTYRRKL
jgi:hypothetical protein